MLLAQKTGADIDVVRLFAIFHDCRRFDDAYDRDHGARGAEFAKLCREEKRFELDDERFGWLYDACRLHTIQPRTGNVTVDTCFDEAGALVPQYAKPENAPEEPAPLEETADQIELSMGDA